jgi:hypothetical protein
MTWNLVGMSTVDRMSHMYSTVIWVPYTIPVDIWSCDYRSWYMAGCQLYFAVLWRPFMGLNMYAAILWKLLYINLYKRVVAVGNAYFNHCNDENPQVSPVAVWVGHVTLLHATRFYPSFKFSNVTLAGYVWWVPAMCFTKLYCRYRYNYSNISNYRVFFLQLVSFFPFWLRGRKFWS